MSAPKNMEEWQRQMKAEKDAERKKKTESAQILHGYHGGVNDADLKLKNLKDEERKKIQDAQENLRKYKAKEIEIAKKDRPKQQSGFPVPVNVAGGDIGTKSSLENIVVGSVGERAAALAAQAAAGTVPAPTLGTQQQAGGLESGAEGVPPNLEAESAPKEASVPEPVAPVVASVDAAAAAPEPVFTTIEEQPQFAPAPVTVEAPAEPPAPKPVVPPPPPAAANPAEPAGAKTVTLPMRLDVLFSFGLVTLTPKQEMENYMAAVRTVVQKALVPGFSFDPYTTPFVKDQQVDASYVSRSGRKDVNRIVVTAAVPVLLTDGSISMKQAKEIVVGALQSSIQSGEFLNLAQAGGS